MVDPILAAAAKKVWPVELRWRAAADFFAALCNEIVSQQLSDKVADVLYGRLNQICAGRITAKKIIRLTDQQLRDTGMSWSKVKFIKNLANAVTTKAINLNQLTTLEDKLVVAELTKLPGIGPWTAQMYLMFALRRPDVWPTGDLGVRAGYARIHGLAETPGEKEMPPLGEAYRPWRSAAAWYCWRALEADL